MTFRRSALLPLVAALSLAGAPVGQSLSVGDAAPSLEVTEWLQGGLLPAAADRPILVVVVWASWCPICRKSGPLLDGLQRRYEPDGLQIVAVASPQRDSLEVVRSFLGESRLGIAVAWDGDRRVDRAWYEASGQSSFPVVFVVDRQGRVAWIGSPLDGLSETLEQVVEGRFDIELAKLLLPIQQQLERASYRKDPEAVVRFAEQWLALQSGVARPWIAKLRAVARDLDDAEAALAVTKAALASLRGRPRELARFAHDGLYALDEASECHAAALETLAAAHRDNPEQAELATAYFAALATTGDFRAAAEIGGEAIALLADPEALASLAESLAARRYRGRFASQALAAIRRARDARPDEYRYDRIELDILATAVGDTGAALAVGERILGKAGGDAMFLNQLAWDLLTEPAYGKTYAKLALRLAEKMAELPEGGHWALVDTLARAKFVNGELDEALALQKRAVGACNDIRYAGELQERLDAYSRAVRDRDRKD